MKIAVKDSTRDHFHDLIYKYTGLVFVTFAEESDPLSISGFLKREAALVLDLQDATAESTKIAKESIDALINNFDFTAPTPDDIDLLTNNIVGAVQTMGTAQLAIIDPISLNHLLEIADSVKAQVQLQLLEAPAPLLPGQITAVEKLHENAGLFSSRFLTEDLSESAQNIVKKVLVDNTTEVAPDILAQALQDALGKVVDAPQSYYQTYATNTLNTARSYSSLSTMQNAGIDKFEIVNPLDNRTTAFCRSMDGKQLSVSNGMKKFDALMQAETIEDIEAINPFVRSEIVNGKPTGNYIIGRGEDQQVLSGNASIATIEDSGISAPPYHHRCRTTLIAVL